MARTHTFKGSASAGYGYFAYIEEGQLVIGEDWGRDGGILFRGSYDDAVKQGWLNKLWRERQKLFSAIEEYYTKEANKNKPGPYAFPHTFNDSRDLHGNGWYGYIENGQLVIGHEAPREGGILFRGTYEAAAERGWIATLLREDQRLYNAIDKYFTKHGVKDESDLKALGFDDKTKTILFKVKLFMDNREVHNVLVRGRFQADVIKKLMPQVPEVLTLQTYAGEVFAVRSGKISAVEFVDEFSTIELRED